MDRLRLFARFLRIAWVFVAAPFRYLGRLLVADGAPDPATRERWQGEIFANALESLGATYVKFGQILGSRPDLLPPGWLAALARLQDDVAPAPWPAMRAMLETELGPERLARFTHIDETPLAAASVAQVHIGVLDTGEKVAIKIQRPEAREQIERDLFLMRVIANALDRIPQLRLLSIPGSVERFGEALSNQLDFTLEAANNRRLAKNFKREKKVRLPAIHDALSTSRVLTMQFVDGVKATQPERVGGDRVELAERGGRAILQMVFADGFVHADLHPGNILLADDGTMTFLDLGMVAEIPPDLMRPWCETFLALAQKDGAAAARLFYVHAPSVGKSDYDDYERDVLEYLSKLWDVRLGDIEVGAVVSGMMNVLRRHQVQIEPVFTVVNVSLLVAEGLGKQLDPQIDLVNLAVPYLLQAQLAAPPGRAPRREVERREPRAQAN
ncbi:ABC1 kinase family protein [Sandaracinus amylolyticus]|uniref:ABC1 kinase family protein n=1 Tax=Sandaracinus amylolyticus TaxID=927083 RepID=UPI001F17D76F|nr:AarF/UbiB family protein [Sandaracinus amylolyticus]UJR78892.1 Ubiquinone biosynthesis monooxygenase UbiB [Sandaracinus amylolyticus]